jgi:hypothetical protein
VENQLRTKQTKRTNLFAEYQMVSAENIIVQTARNQLGLVQSFETVQKVSISKSEVEKLKKELNKKHE